MTENRNHRNSDWRIGRRKNKIRQQYTFKAKKSMMDYGMPLHSELPETDFPPRLNRGLGERPTRESEISLNFDELADLRDNFTRDLSGFSLDCWDEEEDSIHSGSNFFNIVDSLSEKESEGFLKGMKDPEKKDTLDWGGFPDDGRERKVRFSPEFPEVRCIERADPADYPILYYCTHELQKMADETKLEEQNKRRHRTIS